MRVNWVSLLTIGSATVLVGTQVVALAVATGWAAAGLLGLGDIGAYALEGVLSILALVATVAFVRSANRTERVIDPD